MDININQNKNLCAAIFGIFVVVLVAFVFYFGYYIRTPKYSLSRIIKAIDNHDIEKFERYVDLDSLVPKMYDDIMLATARIQGIPLANNPEMLSSIESHKPEKVAKMKKEILSKVSGESSSLENKVGDQNSGRTADSMNFFGNNKLKKTDVLVKEGNSAVASVTLYVASIKQDIMFKIRMTKADGGKWRLKECLNLADVIVEFNDEIKRQDVITKRDIYDYIKVTDIDYYGESGVLDVSWKIRNVCGKNIKKLTGYVVLVDLDDSVYPQPKSELITVEDIASDSSKAANGYLAFSDSEEDNMAYQKLVSLNLCKLSFDIMSVEFEDGTILQRYEYIR